MKTFSIGALIAAAAALGLSILCTFTLDNALSWTDRVNLIFDPASAESFDAYYFAFGTLPLRPLAAHCSVWWGASCSSSLKIP